MFYHFRNTTMAFPTSDGGSKAAPETQEEQQALIDALQAHKTELYKDLIAEKEFDETNKKPKFDLDDQKSQKDQINEIHFNLDQNVEISEDDTNNLDLFNNENQSTNNNHKIDLTEIEQENRDIDEKVLEIPAFLRRQAN